MFKHRLMPVVASAALSAALVVAPGCKKKEEPKPADAAKAEAPARPGEAVAAAVAAAVPVLPDVELVAGEGIAGWVSLQSIGGLFDASDAIAGKLQLAPPGGSLRQPAYDQLSTLLASVGITGHEWLDKTRPVHVSFQDEVAAEGQPPVDPTTGAFAVLPVTDKAKALAAMAAAKKGAEAEGHEALLTLGDKTVYVDFVDNGMVLTTSKDRFAKVKGFVGRLAKVQVPALVYLGISVEDLAKTRQKEIDAFLTQLETTGAAMAGGADTPSQAEVMKTYAKMLKGWVTEMTRVEVLLNADVNNTRFETRIAAKEGTKLHRQLSAGKGRTTADAAALLPANSYLTFAASMDPAASLESLDESMLMLKEMLKLEEKDYTALVEDIKAATRLQTGDSAMAAYPDGTAALGVLIAAGTTDGETAMKLTKRIVQNLGLRLLQQQKAQMQAADPKAPEDPKLAIVEKALQEGKLEPILTAFGPVAKEAGVTLTTNTTKDGAVSCDVLDVAMDWTKLSAQGGEDAKRAQAVIGDKTAISLCTTKERLVMALGPGALEHGKRAAMGTKGGLVDAPAYKAAIEPVKTASWILYANPGMALNAFKAAFPEVPAVPGDRAAVMSCQNRTRSFGCALDVPVELIVAIKAAAMPTAPAAAPMAPGAVPGVAPGTP